MIYRKKLRIVGNCLVIPLPKDLATYLKVGPDDEIHIQDSKVGKEGYLLISKAGRGAR